MIEQSKHYALAITCGAKRGPKDTDLTFSPASLRDFLEALAQPEPEPVGYLYVTDPWGAPEYHFSVEKKEGYFNEPVYKHPPKREPLTDKEIRSIWNDGDCYEEISFARAIEQAHGIGKKK